MYFSFVPAHLIPFDVSSLDSVHSFGHYYNFLSDGGGCGSSSSSNSRLGKTEGSGW
jgi:hypothetical protein